jgi:hypothetical protein
LWCFTPAEFDRTTTRGKLGEHREAKKGHIILANGFGHPRKDECICPSSGIVSIVATI